MYFVSIIFNQIYVRFHILYHLYIKIIFLFCISCICIHTNIICIHPLCEYIMYNDIQSNIGQRFVFYINCIKTIKFLFICICILYQLSLKYNEYNIYSSSLLRSQSCSPLYSLFRSRSPLSCSSQSPLALSSYYVLIMI